MARLHALNVGLPRDIAWQGKIVHTAIWKEPVTGRRMVRRLNIDGDGQGDLAGHGGEHRAVFVYQLEGYRYWQSLLGRTDFTPGEFGENLNRRRPAGSRRVHRRPIPHRVSPVRSHPAACDVLPDRHQDERAAHGGTARVPR